MAAHPSPFISDSPTTKAGDLAIIHISRDHLVPLVLRKFSGAVDGYAEGDVLNTRFGSFPHSTLIGVPWGSQVRASVVDTGSRSSKRKRDRDGSNGNHDDRQPAVGLASALPPETAAASSGFVHVLRPSPELWAMALPHRTQIVYTPDYSFVLQRLRAAPGTRLIEAGSGSGSFTHAAARAVYSGRGRGPSLDRGGVFSFEFDKDRFLKLREEIAVHALGDVVTVTHRNVYEGGFLVGPGRSPRASAVFLDLPAPWKAIRHLSRRRISRSTTIKKESVQAKTGPGAEKHDKVDSAEASVNPDAETSADASAIVNADPNAGPNANAKTPDNPDSEAGAAPTPNSAALAGPPDNEWVSPLDPNSTVYICTFSPCIEQVTRTIATLREHGWVDIDMVEISQRRFGINRERDPPPSLYPRDVSEAVARLKGIHNRADHIKTQIAIMGSHRRESKKVDTLTNEAADDNNNNNKSNFIPSASLATKTLATGTAAIVAAGTTAATTADGMDEGNMDQGGTNINQHGSNGIPSWRAGRLWSRPDPDLKTHTSYLVFAVLPREWTDSDEERALSKWAPRAGDKVVGDPLDRAARKKMKADMLSGQGGKGRKGKRGKKRRREGPSEEGQLDDGGDQQNMDGTPCKTPDRAD